MGNFWLDKFLVANNENLPEIQGSFGSKEFHRRNVGL